MSIERSDIDNYGARNSNKDSYKNRTFDGKRTTKDEYTGKNVYYSSNGHYTTKTTSNVDHVVPIDKLIKRYENELSKEDLSRLANADSNLAITAEKLNKSKSNMNNTEYLAKQFRKGTPEELKTSAKMVKSQVVAEANIQYEVATMRTAQAVNKGVEAGTMALMASSVNNLAKIATGDISLDEALEDIAKTGAGVFATTVSIDLAQKAVSDIVRSCGNTTVANSILATNLPIAELSLIYMVGETAFKFINDEITAEECMQAILLNGAGALAYSIGLALGGAGGAIMATAVVTAISNTVVTYKINRKIDNAKRAQIDKITSEALAVLSEQKEVLTNLSKEKTLEMKNKFDLGFENIINSALTNDVNGVNDGLSLILCIFNKDTKFKTLDEFNDFFDDENSVFVL